MLSFLLKAILKKSLTIPVVWFVAYPTLTGDLVIRGAKLVENHGLAKEIVAEISKIKMSLQWNTVFKEIIVVDDAVVTGVDATVRIEDPLHLIQCLKGGGYSKDKGPAESTELIAQQSEKEGTKRPLKLFVSSFVVNASRFHLSRGEHVVNVRVVELRGENLHLPLNESSFRLEADGFVSFSENSKMELPVRVRLFWNGAEEILVAKVSVVDFPVSMLDMLFPTLFEREQAQLLAAFGGKTAGKLTGNVILEYNNRERGGSKWETISNFPE